MERRTKLALVILIALLLLALGLYLILGQLFSTRQAAAPPAATPTAPYIPPSLPVVPGSASGTVTTPQPVSNDVRVLENRARSIVERIGSGTSRDGFLGYQDVLLEFTEAGRAAVLNEQRALQTAHPVNGPVYGMSTRAAAAHVSSGNSGDARIVLTVEAVQNIDAGDPSRPTERLAKRIEVAFVQQTDGSYLVESLTWSDLEL